MHRSNRSFIVFAIASFMAFASSQVEADVPTACELEEYEGVGVDHIIKLTTAAWTKGDPAQCSIVDANQIVNDGKNNGFNANANLRTNACPEIFIAQDDVVLIDAGGRTFIAGGELFFSENIALLSDAKFTAKGTRVFRVNDGAHLMLAQVKIFGGESDFGGAILVTQGGSLSAYESQFEGGYAEFDGGAIACQSCLLLDLRKTLLAKNHADRNGGALMITASEFAVIRESRLRDNSAGAGGGIYADGPGDVEIKASYIEDNHAIGGDGGGVFSGAYLSASCTKFSGNEAESGNGGGLYQLPAGGQVTIESSYFHKNKTGMDVRGLGGAILVGQDFTLGKSSLVGNEARRGGAIYVHPGAANKPILIENNTIAQNNALIEGGAFWITGDNASVVPDDENNYSESLFGGEFSFRMLHNTIYGNTSENGQIFIFDSGVNASEEILFVNNIIDQYSFTTINCQGNVGRLRTRRLNDLSQQKTNAQSPGQSCGQNDFLDASAAGLLDSGGLFDQGFVETTNTDPADVIVCANVQYKDQFGRLSKCRLGAVRRGPPLDLDDPTAPE